MKQKEITYRPYEDFVMIVGAFLFIAAEALKSRILSNGSILSLGMTKLEIFDFFGGAVFERRMSTLTNKFIGWSYYSYAASSLVANEHSEKRVDIFLNNKKMAYWNVPSDINGLIVKGSPTHADR